MHVETEFKLGTSYRSRTVAIPAIPIYWFVLAVVRALNWSLATTPFTSVLLGQQNLNSAIAAQGICRE